jgi:hypothetical protein
LHTFGAIHGNANESKETFTGGTTKDTELLAEKHDLFRGREVQNGKLLQFTRLEERTPVEHWRETFWMMS